MPVTIRFIFRIVFLVALLIAPAAALAETDYTYIDPQTLPPMLLPPPPTEGSAAWRKEINRTLAAQAHISPAELAAMRNEQHMRLELMTDIISKDFTRDRFPKTFALLDNVMNDTRLVTEADKQHWHMRRPYLTDTHIKLLIDPLDKSFAYPSGHTSESRILAEVLGMLYPEKLEALRARARTIARHRIEAGVHYPVDIAGGETLAAMVTGALMENAGFQDDMENAQQEIAQAQ